MAFGKNSKVTFTECIKEAEDLKVFLRRMSERYPSFGAMIYNANDEMFYESVVVFVNDRPVPKDLKLKIKNGDTIAFTPYYSGG